VPPGQTSRSLAISSPAFQARATQISKRRSTWRVGYAQSYSFKYSERPGTPGAELPEQVPDGVKVARLETLQALLHSQHLEFNRSLIGREADVLLEKRGRYASQLIARSPWLQSVIVDASSGEIGDIIRVRITDAGPLSLKAEPVACK
jgi:tRNA-2-methylthio-N6-dimethylallyladenosine synthase